MPKLVKRAKAMTKERERELTTEWLHIGNEHYRKRETLQQRETERERQRTIERLYKGNEHYNYKKSREKGIPCQSIEPSL